MVELVEGRTGGAASAGYRAISEGATQSTGNALGKRRRGGI